MRTGCIKTGCRVHFPNYGQVISADVFRVGNTLLIRTNPNQLEGSYETRNRSDIELTVESNSGRNEFWRPDVGVIVVPEDECVWTGPHP